MDLRKMVLLIILILLSYVYVVRLQSEPFEVAGNISQMEKPYPLHSEEKPLSPLDFIRRGLSRPRLRPMPFNSS